jgi:hypothetical protein
MNLSIAVVLLFLGASHHVSAELVWHPFGASEYAMGESSMTWHQARDYAYGQGAILACITSAAENQFVHDNFAGNHLWLGATDEIMEGVWLWLSGEPFVYAQWCSGEPNNAISSEDYLHFDMREGGCWNDLYNNHPAAHPFPLLERQFETVDIVEIPASFQLGNAYPNPFNPNTSIPFELAETTSMRLTVLDLAGRELAVLVDGLVERGQHQLQFDGSALASGMYLLRLEAGGESDMKKLLLVK